MKNRKIKCLKLKYPSLLFQNQIEEHQTLIIEEFEPDVFRQLIEYIHTGCVTLQPRTLLGVMNAADYYGLEELKHACSGFIQVGNKSSENEFSFCSQLKIKISSAVSQLTLFVPSLQQQNDIFSTNAQNFYFKR